MKYILRYETKSKYLGFVKVHYEEFDTIEDLMRFLILHNKKIIKYEFFKRK